MKPAPFAYARPESLDEALELMRRHGEEARPLAGGQSLVPLLAMRLARPAVVVDLNRLPELAGMEVAPHRLRIGAGVRLAALERDPAVAGRLPVLREALAHVAHFQVRNRSTFGGCLAHADPAAEVPALALLLGATVQLRSAQGERALPVAEFLRGAFTTAIQPGELVVAVDLPFESGGWAFAEVARREGDFALVGAAAVHPRGGAGRAVVFGAGSAPQLVDGADENAIQAVSDIHASAVYRRRVGARLVARVLGEAERRPPAAGGRED